jgi:integrase
MAKRTHKLNAMTVQHETKPGLHADGDGLYLQVTPRGTKSWVVRFWIAGKAREMGLGAFPDVPLADARERAADARRQVSAGVDPIEARKAAKAEREGASHTITFDEATARFLDAHLSTWRNPKHRQQWQNTLTSYASPEIGSLAVATIETRHIAKVLDPIWRPKPETASRVRGRIERVLNWAATRGYRSGPNPARWRGHLDQVYPSKSKVRPVKHHAAVPVDDMPAVYAALRDVNGIAALAARFVILTAARVSMVTGARTSEFGKSDLWSLSAERMKATRDFIVPLTAEAKAVLQEAARWRALHDMDGRANGLVFPGLKNGRPLSETAVIKALRAAGAGKATTHGCRSTFKDWASERTVFANEVSEMALAHAIGDKTEAAYRRGDLLGKRTELMEVWASFVTTPAAAKPMAAAARERALIHN